MFVLGSPGMKKTTNKVKPQTRAVSPGCPGPGSLSGDPSLLDFDLEQLLKSGQAPAWAFLQARKQPWRNQDRTAFCSPRLLLAVTSPRPHFYAHHLNLYFVSRVEMVSSGPFYAVLTACHLFAPPQTAVLHRLREVLEHRQWPCRPSRQTTPGFPDSCFCEVLVSLVFHMIATIFCIYTLVLHSRRLALL